MRIGLISGEYPPMQGGVGAHCRELARALTEQGHIVFVYSDARASEIDSRIAVTRAPAGWGPQTLRSVNRWAHDNRLDVVNLHFQTAAYQMSPFIHWLPDLVAAPVVTTFHDLRIPYLFPKAGRLRNWIVMRLARASEGVISTNHGDFARLRHLPRVGLIPIGSSVRGELPADFDREACRAKYGAAETDFVVAHFGFINHTKGVETLLEAVRLNHEDGISLKIWLIGGRTGASDPTNAAYAAEIELQITMLGLNDRVTWTGFLSDAETAACLAASDVVALLFRDGASYRRSSLMAAISQGCAIITTAPVVQIPAFKHGDNLQLVPVDDPAVTSQSLRELWANPIQVERLRHGARQLARDFAWEGIARANADFFERVVSQVGR